MFVGIDLGTSSVKMILVDNNQQIISNFKFSCSTVKSLEMVLMNNKIQ